MDRQTDGLTDGPSDRQTDKIDFIGYYPTNVEHPTELHLATMY